MSTARSVPVVAALSFLFSLVTPHCGFAADPLSPPVQSYLSAPDQPRLKVWVYFTDHGESGSAGLSGLLRRVEIPPRALERRMRRARTIGADPHDLAVAAQYVDAVRALGCEVHRSSKYLNAVSAWASPGQLEAIARLPFVQRIDRVATGTRPLPDSKFFPPGGGTDANETPGSAAAGGIEYGLSAFQQWMTDTPPLHAAGLHGEGVRVAVLDTGFFVRHGRGYPGHPAFDSLNVIAQWDFINDDSVTADEASDFQGQMSHGTGTLGIIAANWPGRVMGTAWAAQYILAKTERLLEEIQVEEDDYVAALEWADGLGVDVVSSSLGYYAWYSYADMDGKTAVCTRAVEIAASHGILVVTAIGNFGGHRWPSILAPADADTAVAVGAADSSGAVMFYSSQGPTWDGRIKPDVLAYGRLLITLDWQYPFRLGTLGGTSAATPLVAGACALILQKHPDWSPVQVRDALRATASHAKDPNDDHGWGLVDAYAASNYARAIRVAVEVEPGSCDNPFNPKRQGILPTFLLGGVDLDVRKVDVASLRLAGAKAVRTTILDAEGAGGDLNCANPSPDGFEDLWVAFQAAEMAASLGPAARGDTANLALTGQLADGTPIEGRCFVRIVGAQRAFELTERSPGEVLRTGLGSAFPNPFNPATRISYHLAAEAHVDLLVYDVLGRQVAILENGVRPPVEHSVAWDASSQASGVYFYRLRAGGFEQTRKFLLLK